MVGRLRPGPGAGALRSSRRVHPASARLPVERGRRSARRPACSAGAPAERPDAWRRSYPGLVGCARYRWQLPEPPARPGTSCATAQDNFQHEAGAYISQQQQCRSRIQNTYGVASPPAEACPAYEQSGKRDPGQQREHRLVVPPPGSAVQSVTKQPTGQQSGRQQNEARRHKSKRQALEREQWDSAVGIFSLPNALLCACHEPGMHHGGGKQPIAGNAQCQVQRQPGGRRHVQRLARKKHRQHNGQCPQCRQYPARLHLRKQLPFHCVHRQHQPRGHRQGGRKTKAGGVAPQAPHQDSPVQHPGHQQRIARRCRAQSRGCGGWHGVCHGGGQGQKPAGGRATR